MNDEDYQKYLHLKDDYAILQTFNRNISRELDDVKRELCQARLELAKKNKKPVSGKLEAFERLKAYLASSSGPNYRDLTGYNCVGDLLLIEQALAQGVRE